MFLTSLVFIFIVRILLKAISFKFIAIAKHQQFHMKMKLFSSLPTREESMNQIYNNEEDNDVNDIEENLKYFREYAKRGISRFQNGDLDNALKDMDRARGLNTTQILPQRGIMLYIANNYTEACIQLLSDINQFEQMKLYKASELRIWCSACYNKLGKLDKAKEILDLDNRCGIPTITQSSLINNTLSFYGQQLSLEDLLEQIGQVDEKDIYGIRYYGNFYLGLFYDSINELGLSQAFLMIPNESNRYNIKDMWYHVPRMLYKRRFESNDNDSNDNNESHRISSNSLKNDNINGKEWYEKQHINSAGMIIK